jgi:GNAT superfamily N-acetyltransferase
MVGYGIRPAVEADLERINAIWYQDEVADDEHPPEQGAPLALYPYLMEQGDVRVALDDQGAVAGFGAAITWRTPRGPLTYLSDLFVAADAQSRGVGQALLAALLTEDGARCVLASKDPRAIALYIRYGMPPQWQNYWLSADSSTLAMRIDLLPGADVTLELANVRDADLARWDAELCGFERTRDLRWMIETRDAEPFWLTRDGERLGYAYIQRRADESLWRPDAWTVGPVGARSASDAAVCVGAVVRYASVRASSLRLATPSPHPALRSLIEAGFRIVYIETFLASPGATPFDPARYLPGGALL